MNRRAFTLAELMIVLLILCLSALAIIPLAGTDERTDVRAAAELLAADIEETQARNLANPRSPTCLVPNATADGWHLALAEAPHEPISGVLGDPHRRRFGSGSLATARTLRLIMPSLPADGLRFDDQGAPVMGSTPIQFRIEGTETGHSAKVTLSSATGRVSIVMASGD